MTITILSAVGALAAFIAVYAICLVGEQAALIEAQRQRIELGCEATAIATKRADCLADTLRIQYEHAGVLVEQVCELEDRNALLERVVKVRGLAIILDMSVMDGPTVLGRVRQMSRN